MKSMAYTGVNGSMRELVCNKQLIKGGTAEGIHAVIFYLRRICFVFKAFRSLCLTAIFWQTEEPEGFLCNRKGDLYGEG